MPNDAAAKGLSLLGRDGVGSTKTDHVGPLQAADWLAERTAGKHVAKSEWLERIDQHNVQIAGQAPVLETIVEHDDLAAILGNRSLGGGHSIGILHVRHMGK
jgi:hypothetical protein